jgi:hypothetical protein
MKLMLVCALATLGCDPDLDAEGQKLALAADGVSTGLEASFKAGWLLAPAAQPNADAIDATRIILNTLFGWCASAEEPVLPARGLYITFSGRCGVPLTDLRFKGGLGFEVSPVEGGGSTLAIVFTNLEVPSVALDGRAEFTTLPDGAFAWQFAQMRFKLGNHHFGLDGAGSVLYSSDRTSVRFDGAGRFASDVSSVAWVADGIERRMLAGCWPERGTLTVSINVLGKERVMIYHYTGDREVRLDDRGRILSHELPDRECRPLF